MKKFRVFMLAALSILLLSSIVACGTTKVSGEEKTYSNAAKTFSVQLPAEDKGSWKVNKDTTDDVLEVLIRGTFLEGLTLAIRFVSCTSFSYVLLRLTSTDSGSYSAPVLTC